DHRVGIPAQQIGCDLTCAHLSPPPMNNVCLSTVSVKVIVTSQYPDACSSLPATLPQLRERAGPAGNEVRGPSTPLDGGRGPLAPRAKTPDGGGGPPTPWRAWCVVTAGSCEACEESTSRRCHQP